jgi:hypothetical protein
MKRYYLSYPVPLLVHYLDVISVLQGVDDFIVQLYRPDGVSVLLTLTIHL